MSLFTKAEAADYLRCVQAGTLEFNAFKVEISLEILGDKTTVTQFQSALRSANRVERRRPSFVVLTPTGAGRRR